MCATHEYADTIQMEPAGLASPTSRSANQYPAPMVRKLDMYWTVSYILFFLLFFFFLLLFFLHHIQKHTCTKLLMTIQQVMASWRW